MTSWTPEELDRLDAEEELRIASQRADGSLRKPVIIWMVRHRHDVYVRSVNGRGAAWFKGTQDRRVGHVQTREVARDVTFVDADGLGDELDAAYRAKYRRYAGPILDSVLTPQAQGASLRLDPLP